MKLYLLSFYIAFFGLSYGVEPAKPPPAKVYCKQTCKQRGKKGAGALKPSPLPTQKIECNLKDTKITVTNDGNFLKNHVAAIKKFYDCIDKTIQQVTNNTPTSSQIARIMFGISNLINNIDSITQSNHLDRASDVINDSDDLDAINIYELLCDAKNFLYIFSHSFIDEVVKELPVENEFGKKIESDWYKNGFVNLTKCITTLERFAELESCREDIMSFSPLVQKNHKQISDVISKMVTADSETFLKEASEFVDSIQNFSSVLKQIETNTCLVNSKSIAQAQEIVSLAKTLHTYFFDLSNKLKEILEEIAIDEEGKASENVRHYNCKSDGFIQDIIHDIFLCKYNKIFYKQMNNEVGKLITLIKSLEEVKE